MITIMMITITAAGWGAYLFFLLRHLRLELVVVVVVVVLDDLRRIDQVCILKHVRVRVEARVGRGT